MARSRWIASLAVAAVLAGLTPAAAQYWGRRNAPPRFPGPTHNSVSRFVFCRVMYTSVRREWLGHGWNTDYPQSDINFMKRFEEFTTGRVSRRPDGRPDHVVVTLLDDKLFSYPFLFMSDVGTVGFSAQEQQRLREYLLKGGFLWVDDFWGTPAWRHWEKEIAAVLPSDEYPIEDVGLGDSLFRGMYDVDEVPQIPSIQHWRRTGGKTTSEQGMDSAVPHVRGIRDAGGRLMVVMSHNTDIADGWERENEEFEFFHRFSADAYAVGINVVLYAMTH